jgi:hypothetical protein
MEGARQAQVRKAVNVHGLAEFNLGLNLGPRLVPDYHFRLTQFQGSQLGACRCELHSLAVHLAAVSRYSHSVLIIERIKIHRIAFCLAQCPARSKQ